MFMTDYERTNEEINLNVPYQVATQFRFDQVFEPEVHLRYLHGIGMISPSQRGLNSRNMELSL